MCDKSRADIADFHGSGEAFFEKRPRFIHLALLPVAEPQKIECLEKLGIGGLKKNSLIAQNLAVHLFRFRPLLLIELAVADFTKDQQTLRGLLFQRTCEAGMDLKKLPLCLLMLPLIDEGTGKAELDVERSRVFASEVIDGLGQLRPGIADHERFRFRQVQQVGDSLRGDHCPGMLRSEHSGQHLHHGTKLKLGFHDLTCALICNPQLAAGVERVPMISRQQSNPGIQHRFQFLHRIGILMPGIQTDAEIMSGAKRLWIVDPEQLDFIFKQ